MPASNTSSGSFHAASDAELDILWRAVDAAHLLPDKEALGLWRRRDPWSVRLSDAGEAVLLQRWREDLDILHIRAVWCAPKHVEHVLADVRRVAEEQRLQRMLSPVLSETALAPYVDAGLSSLLALVAYTWRPSSIRSCDPPNGVRIRPVVDADLKDVAAVDAMCFSQFWAHTLGELAGQAASGHMCVAEENGEVVGYTFTTLSRGSATLARVAVRPETRRAGVGCALLSAASMTASRAGASTMSLCTQETNDASRALYASMGLLEVSGRLLLAADASVRF